MASPCQKGGMRLSEALDNMQLAYNPITKQLHFVSPKIEKPTEDTADDIDKLSKKSSFSDEGNFSISTCEKSDTSDSPKSTLNWGGSVSGHKRGKDGGSFSSTVSSLSECSLGSSASKEEEGDVASEQDHAKLKKKGLSGFFSRLVNVVDNCYIRIHSECYVNKFSLQHSCLSTLFCSWFVFDFVFITF